MGSLEEIFKYLVQLQHDQALSLHQTPLPFWLLWLIWKGKNHLIFRRRKISIRETLDYATADVHEWISNVLNPLSATTKNRHQTSSPNLTWQRPLFSTYKCNYDAAYNLNSGRVQGGWIVRDNYSNA